MPGRLPLTSPNAPTPRALDRRRSSTAVTTAAALAAYHSDLTTAGLPPGIVNDLVLAAGRTLVHAVGLTTTTTTPAGTTTTTIGGPAACRCARRGEGK